MRRSITRSAKPIAVLTETECFEAVRAASRAFAEATNMPPRYVSRSWFLNEFARLLGQAKRVPGSGARLALRVQTELSFTSLGNFSHLINGQIDSPIDLLACPPWSRLELSDEEYGTDEQLLPPFYLIRMLFNREDEWIFPEDIAGKFGGPLTVTVLYINLLGPDRSFRTAKHFERSMKERMVDHHVSTQFIIPGLLAAVTSAERTEPHQVLVASQIFDREPVANPKYGEVRE